MEIGPILACLLGAMLSSLGMVLQKVAHMQTNGRRDAYYMNPKWFAGFAVYSMGDFILFLTLWYLPQAIVAVLGTWTLVANFGFAACLLQEKLDAGDLIATYLILLGTSIAVYSYKSREAEYSVPELVRLLTTRSVHIFVVVIVVLLVVDLVWLCADSTPRSILVRVSQYGVEYRKRSRSFSYIFAASIVNTLVMLLGKCIAVLASAAFGTSQSVYALLTAHGSAFMFIFLACGAVCILNVHLVNKALESGDALFIVPSYFVLGLIFKVTSGIVFFQDYTVMTYTEMGLFIVGCFINISGVYVLAHYGIDDEESEKTLVSNNGTTVESLRLTDYDVIERESGDEVMASEKTAVSPKYSSTGRFSFEAVRTPPYRGRSMSEGSGNNSPTSSMKRVSSVSLFGFNVH